MAGSPPLRLSGEFVMVAISGWIGRFGFGAKATSIFAILAPRRREVGVTSVSGFRMDSLITAAARALASGDALGALNYVALRDDPPALALRGVAMAQLGDLDRAKALLARRARVRPARGRRARAMRHRRGRDRAGLARPRLVGEGARHGA